MDKQELQDLSNQEQALWTYRIAQLEIKLEAGFAANANKLDGVIAELKRDYATKTELEACEARAHIVHRNLKDDQKALAEDIAKVQSWLDWGTRIIIGAIIAAVLAVIGLNR